MLRSTLVGISVRERHIDHLQSNRSSANERISSVRSDLYVVVLGHLNSKGIGDVTVVVDQTRHQQPSSLVISVDV